MAQEGALRYLVSAWTVLTIGLFAIIQTQFKPARWILAGWIILNLFETGISCSRAIPRSTETKKLQQTVAQTAAELGAKTGHMSDGYIFGHYGQTYGWMATNRIQFVSNFDERRQGRAQHAEIIDRPFVACPNAKFLPTRATFNSLGIRTRRLDSAPVSFFYDYTIDPRKVASVSPVSAITTDGKIARELFDRRYHTEITGRGYVFDLGKSVPLARICLTGTGPYQSGLRGKFTISVSANGIDYTEAHPCPGRVPVGYHLENMVYIQGFFGQMECAMNGVSARYVRFTVAEDEEPITANEVFFFADRGARELVSNDEIKEINEHLEQQQTHFLVTDRWLSAQLWGRSSARVYPRYNSKYLETHISRLLESETGLAIAVHAGLEGETSRVLLSLYGTAAIKEIINTQNYRIFILEDAPRLANTADEDHLLWNGHALLIHAGIEPPWY